jgi:hypothetical protein
VRAVDAIVALHQPIHEIIYRDSTLENALIDATPVGDGVAVVHFWSRADTLRCICLCGAAASSWAQDRVCCTCAFVCILVRCPGRSDTASGAGRINHEEEQ